MRRYALPGLITLIAVGLLALLAFGVANDGSGSALVGQVQSGRRPLAPNSKLQLPVLGSSRTEDLADLRGHVVMIEFFAGWCESCQLDARFVSEAQRMLTKHGGTVLGVLFKDNSPDAFSYLHQYHLSIPVLRDSNGDLASVYGVSGVPETFIVNPDGRVIDYRIQPLNQSWLNQTLAKAISTNA